ncbi:MAG: hypothetical protein K0S74_1146 [Chlamydiales bacterium]|jgi:hypothetical protein|nr:hypothetical protein [Chlamydiales bacterium]
MNPMSLIVRDPNTSIVPLSQEEYYVQERALLALENEESLEAHLKNAAIHQMRDQTENSLRQIIRKQEEQLKFLAKEKELLATENTALKGRVKELDETHKKEIWQLKVHPLFKDANELVIALGEIQSQYKHGIYGYRYAFVNMLSDLGAGNPKPIKAFPILYPQYSHDPENEQYQEIINSFFLRIKHLPHSQLNEVMAVIYQNCYKTNPREYGLNVSITTLTPGTIQRIIDLHYNY